MAEIHLSWNSIIDAFGTPSTKTSTQVVLPNRDGLTSTVLNGTGFTYNSITGLPSGGTISSISLVLNGGSTTLQTLTNVAIGFGDIGNFLDQVMSLRDQITWSNVVDQEPEAVIFTPTQIRLLNTDGTFTDAIGTGLAVADFQLSGTISSIQHVASDGTTVLTNLTGLNVSLATAGSALFDEVASEQLYVLANQGNNTMTGVSDGVVVGSDIIYSHLFDGPGDDSINAALNVWDVSYQLAPAGVQVNLATGVVTGGGGNDLLSGMNSVEGSFFDDALTGNSNFNGILGWGGNDTISGGAGGDWIGGGDGDDSLDGGTGIDTVTYHGNYEFSGSTGVTVSLAITGPQNTGGAGIDTLANFENLAGSDFADTLAGNSGNNLIDGHSGNDKLNGGAGNDTLSGGDGNDLVIGGAGADALNGGAGVDVASYAGSTTGVTANLAAGTASGGHAVGDTFTSIENLVGSAHADILTGNGFNNVLNGALGNDTLVGSAGNDTLSGGDGNDTLNGGAGADTLNGGTGIDAASYAGSTAGVTVNLAATGPASNGHAAGDTFIAIENLVGSAHADRLTGNAGSNALGGGLGNDTLFGGGGNDTLAGGDGNDTLNGGAGADALNGGAGIDAVSYAGSAGGVTVNLVATGPASGGHAVGDTFTGIENLIGSAHADSLTGNGGNNALSGGAGNDTLAGRFGNDAISGGAGADTFVFDTALGAGNVDRIIDFSVADDTIRLDDAIFTALATGDLSVSAFATGAAAGDADDRIIYDSTSGALYYDVDGTGVIGKLQFAILVSHPGNVTSADLVVI
jgi:Ca2+-binding RTX toxin-like protein